jgi:dTDP-4-amino-4,6-dideoxygalactose transaminase
MSLYAGNDQSASLPITEEIAQSIMTLPISASMTPDDADCVIKHFRAVMK